MKAIIESLLFAYGEPLTIKRLTNILESDPAAVQSALEEMEHDFAERGIVLIKKDNAYQLGTNPAHAATIESLMKSDLNEELTRSALETLAIIAYKGPLTRVRIEHMRGVNSSFTIRNLMMRGLIERTENPDNARSYLYRVTFDFLKNLGLKSIDELPSYEEHRKSETI